MPMNNRIMVPRQTLHPEALAWRTAVIANGGTASAATVNAMSVWFKTIQAAGVRPLIYRWNWLAGDFAAALVPCIRGPVYGGTTYGGTTDTNVNFVSGDYSLSAGLRKASNTTAYLNTLFPANTIAAASAHLGCGLLATETRAATSRSAIGAYNGASNSFEFGLRSPAASFLGASFTRFATTSDTFGDNVGTGGSALAVGNIVAAYPTMFRNGVATGTAATTSQNYPSAHNFYVFANNNSGSSAINYTDARLGWYSIGLTMTAAQALALSNACNAFYTAIGRS